MKILFPILLTSATIFAAVRDSQPVHVTPGKINEAEQKQITPMAGPHVEHGIDAFITGDFLYWTARMDGLGYITTGVGNGISSTGKGSVKYPDWQWAPGFKAGIGLNLPHDGWDIFAKYTWLHSSSSNSHRFSDSGVVPNWNIANIFSFPQDINAINHAKVDGDIHFSSIDVSLGRNFFISKFLILRPFIGFKGGWIDTDYHVHYEINSDSITSDLRMKNDQNYWGIGLRSGLETAWHLTPVWSIYGDFALSALWSQFEITRTDSRNDSRNPGGQGNPPLNTSVTQFNSEDSFHTMKGALEFSLGLRGEWWFFENRYHFLIQGGWEEQLWLNMNNLIKTYFIQSNHGDLILQGLTIKARFDF